MMATYSKVPVENVYAVKRKPVPQPTISPGQTRENRLWVYVSIALVATALIFPAVILPTILLILVLTNIRNLSDPWFRVSNNGHATDAGVYYVEYSSSRLLTIASWASTVAPFLATLAMMLLVFHSAKQLRTYSASQRFKLPTPYQFGLTLSGLAGDLSTAWKLLFYLCFWKQRKRLERVSVDVFAILGVVWILGYSIVAVDTWLHVTTDAVQLLVPKQSSQINGSYGWSINYTTASGGWPYSAYTTTFNSFFNASANNRIAFGQDGGRTFAYLSSPLAQTDQDYQATTIGAETNCTLVNKYCHYGDYSLTGLQFNCTWGLKGRAVMNDQSNSPSQVGVTTTQNGGSSVWQMPPCCGPKPSDNQFEYTVWGLFSPSDGGIDGNSNLYHDPGFNTIDQFNGWFANCSTARYILDYSLTAGQFKLNAEPKSINLSTVSQLSSIYFSGRVAQALSATNTGKELLDTYALFASQSFAASTSPFVNETLNKAETKTVIGTRVQKAPLFLLAILNYLYAVIGICLAVLALRSDPIGVQEIVGKMNVFGIVAAKFEPERDGYPAMGNEELFEEGAVLSSGQEIARIGLATSRHGGWKLQRS